MAHDMGENAEMTDYSISIDVHANTGDTYNNDVGITFGYVDSQNYYTAQWIDYSDSYSEGSHHKDFNLVKVEDGHKTILDTIDQTDLGNNFNLSVDVSVTGGIVVSVDGVEKLTAVGEHPAIQTFGVNTGDNDQGVSYDNVVVKNTNVVETLSTDEDTPTTILSSELLANDTDADGDTLTISSVQDASHGTVSLDTDGNILFTPDAEYSGEATFTYTVTDGNGGESTATATVNITSANNAAVITVVDNTVDEDISTIIATATDIDGTVDSSTLSALHGTVSMDEDGNIIYTSDQDYNGSDTVSVSVTDSSGAVTSREIDLTVNSTNENPVAVDDISTYADVTTTTTIFNTDFQSIDIESDSATGIETIDGWSSAYNEIEIRDEGGEQFIELNTDPSDTYTDAPNIFREVNTVDGAEYTLDFDFSARPGYDENVCAMEVLVNGEVVGRYSADGTNLDSASWTNSEITFTGNGEAMQVEFRESGDDVEQGRGIWLDNVTLVETLTESVLQNIETDENTAIVVDVLANDRDADEDRLTITEVQGQDVSSGQVVNITSTDGENTLLGTAQVTDGKVLFTPDESLQIMDNGEHQTVSFEYTVSDGEGSSRATVSLNVNGVDEAAEGDIIFMGDDKKETAEGSEADDIIFMGSGKDQVAYGEDGDDTILMGDGKSAKNQEAHGGEGDDTIEIDGKDFEAYGEAGDDTFNVNTDDFKTKSGSGSQANGDFDGKHSLIDGGEGLDALVFSDDMNIDFSVLDDNIANMEVINLGEGSQNITLLTVDDVLEMTDTDNILRIDGDASDSIELNTTGNDAEWTLGDFKTDAETGATYQEVTSVEGDSTVTLEISTNIEINES